MPVDSSAHIDIRSFINAQGKERYKAFIVHGRPLSGKTAFAKKVVKQLDDVVYLDLLQYVAERQDLASSVDTLDAAALQQLVIEYAGKTDAAVLLVDEIDFLVHVWGDSLQEFKRVVERLSVTQTPTTIAFIMQTQPELDQWSLRNSRGQSRILNLDDILAI